jgi:hypothetical protein
MGTRNLTIVTVDGVRKVAQYCQWDGYPSGVGRDIAKFLSDIGEGNKLKDFTAKVRALEWATPEEVEKAWAKCGADGSGLVDMGTSDKAKAGIAEFHRDTGPGILGLIMLDKVKRVQDSSSFADDKVFCEWVYDIDLTNKSVAVSSFGKKKRSLSFKLFTGPRMVKLLGGQ